MPDSHTGLPLILTAAAFAAERHRDQRRKDAEASPYINHPLALAAILAGEGNVEDPAVIAAEVARIVAEVTDDKSLPKAVRKELQVSKAAHKSPKAKLVKLADKIANLRDLAASPPADWAATRINEYAAWSARVVAGLRGANPALEAAFDAAHARLSQC